MSIKAGWKIENMRRRVNRARKGFFITCPSSRHLHTFADNISSRGTKERLVTEENKHLAQSLYAVLESLWKTRAENIRLKQKLEDLQE